MSTPAGTVTPAEERFEKLRQTGGFIAAPILFLVCWFVPIPSLSSPAHHLLAILVLVVVLWISEAIPLPATALLGPALCVLSAVGSARDVFKSFADPIIFLFLGSFILAQAMFEHGLNRRIAFRILSWPAVGESPARLLAAFGGVTAFISMWISNTATTAMMFPIAVSMLSEMARLQQLQTGQSTSLRDLKFGAGLMLMTAFAASVGGLATPVGSPPNLIGIGLIEKGMTIRIGFFQWMMFGLPLAVLLVLFLIVYLNSSCPAPGKLFENPTWLIHEKTKLGPISRAERNVLLAFSMTVGLWILPGVIALVWGASAPAAVWFERHLPEGVVALLGALLLFALPVNWERREFTISWEQAAAIDWGTILLFGGGLALGERMFSTGLAEWIGGSLVSLLHVKTAFGLICLFTVLGVLVSETTSNAASASMVVPVALAVAKAAGVNPLQTGLAACLGASMGFMLPVSTPPNAIVYGSGCIPILKMVRHGVMLDVVGSVLIVLVVYFVVPLLF